MASSLLTGDRRWAPTRKSGMTVLGKVPKPINLPSQRLENHGLDPNVEIVPKGTLTWGSRQSLATPNAWGSSNLSSPNTDGSSGLPTHVNGRPSSGGSGTRPSTAGSDRSHEPASNVWGPNSRPSTASGILASNQISQAATRPRSAETRPGSSQLSRFAENTVDSPVAWGATGSFERLGAVSSKTNFTLSSGDFPTLGSEKSSESQIQRGHSSQGHPASASGTSSAQKETLEPQLAGNRNLDHSVHGNVNTWKAENFPSPGRGSPPNMENWQKDPQQAQSYPSGDVPPHQFDSWHNSPFHPSDGVWYRGGVVGGPYRPPGPPGNYPVEPYYPHVPARSLPNAQAFLRPEAGPGGFHPKNGDSYRPHMPLEPYMVPSHSAIPVRPGVYPGPGPYEAYYGPPRGNFSSSSDREVPVLGIAAQPGVYNQYPTQNKFHDIPGGYSHVMTNEQMKSDQAHEPQGQYRVLLKPHDGWEGHDARDKREQSVIAGAPHLERGNQPRVSMRDGDWRTNSKKHEPASSQPASGHEGHSSDTVVRNLLDDSSKVADGSLMRKSETATIQVHDLQQYPVTKKNATLMEKVEGLNTKARTTDCHNEVGVVSSKGKTKSFKDVSSLSTNADHFTKVVYANAASTENVPTSSMARPVPSELNAFIEDKNQESSADQKVSSGPSELQDYVVGKSKTVEAGENTHFQDRKRIHGIKGIDHRAKLRSSRHDNDEWMKKSTGSNSLANTIVANSESSPGVCEPEYHASQEAPEKQELHHAANADGGSYIASSLDTVDQKAQRAKIKERAIQRQKEEDERSREQKAKALAKLEELNRRTSTESSNLKSNRVPSPNNNFVNKPESEAGAAPTVDATFTEAPSGTLPCDSEAVKQTNDDGIKNVGESTYLSSDAAAQASDSASQASVVPQDQFMSPGQETKITEITQKTTTDIHENIVSKQKQMDYRRQSIPQEKNLGEKQTTCESTGNPKYVGKVAVNAPSSDTLPNNENPSVQHRKKNNRSTRNRSKLDETLSSSTAPSLAQTEGNSEKCGTGSGNPKPSASVAEAESVPAESLNETVGTQGSRGVAVISSNQGWSESTEETHGRVSNHWKPHIPRKSTRNQQAHKPVAKYHGTEAVIWAPVRLPNKNEPSEEVSQNSTIEATNPPPGKNVHDVQNGTKAKRAEMERYVPKPVAKELSQQGNSQQTSPPLIQLASGDISGKPEPGSASVGSVSLDGATVAKASFASDTKNGETSKHNKHGRTHASWRQRGSAEPPSLSQNSLDGSLSSDPTKTVQKGSEQLQPSKVDSLPKGLSTYADDDWNGDNELVPPSESDTTTTAAKNYGTSRQRCQPYKAHRVIGSNYAPTDNKDLQRGMANKSETQPPDLGLRTDNQNASGEHMRSHWQPKSQSYSQYGRQGNRGGGGQRFASQSGQSDKEYPPQGTENNPMQNEDNNAPSQKTVGAEARDAGHQEAKRDGKAIVDPLKEQTPNLKEDSSTTVEVAPAIDDVQQEQSVSSIVHRRGQYNGRFQRGQGMTYRGSDSGQDAGRQNPHINGDKRKNNLHLEYQRIGSYNPNVGDEAQEGLRAPGSRYRERGRHHPRGGGGRFYGRSSGAVDRVGDSYNSGE